MKLYVLEHAPAYESSNLLGVYSTQELAESTKTSAENSLLWTNPDGSVTNFHRNLDDLIITELELDAPPC